MAVDITQIAETSIGAGRDLADRTTPLIRDEWYVAALAQEVTRQPLQRVILNQDVLLYRTEAGVAVALQNRCAHRSHPLSAGVLKGDNIVCPYHGFEYASDGRCVRVPSLAVCPPAIRVQAYPTLEQGPFVWIWTGDGPARHERFFPQPWFTEPGWRAVGGYFHMRAHYLGLHENLLDLSHFPFLHDATIGRPEYAEQRATVTVEDGVLSSTVLHRDAPIPEAVMRAGQLTGPVDRLVESIVPGPAVSIGCTRNTDSSAPPKVFHRHIVHCITPESQASTHYFWAMARDIGIDNADIDRALLAVGAKAFEEDRTALERIERLTERDVRPGFRNVLVPADAGPVRLLQLFASRARHSRG